MAGVSGLDGMCSIAGGVFCLKSLFEMGCIHKSFKSPSVNVKMKLYLIQGSRRHHRSRDRDLILTYPVP